MVIAVKICGLNSAEAVDATVQAGVEYAGLNFHDRSPRCVTLDAAASLANRMRGRTKIVALLNDSGDEHIAAVARAVRPDMLQFNGAETPDRIGAIRTRFDLPVMKAVAIAEASDFVNVAAYEAAADMILFDTKAPAGATRTGGHGVAFDWQLLRGRSFTKPWLLAGGLNSENVARAIHISEASGVDISSGVETAPGVKSAEMIRAFVTAARNAHYATEQQA
jgi:phosphoribosylanthranilate isomerase